MSQMQVPVTDAFDQTDPLESLEVELTPEQIEWLRETAAERGLSIDHMLRSIITAQMRGVDDSAERPSNSGDGAAHSAPVGDGTSKPSAPATPTDAADDENERSDPPSIVESLRSASERLQNLTEEDDTDDADTSGLHDTLTRLKAHIDSASDSETSSSEESTPGTVVLDNKNRSMFDMMDEE